MVFSDLELSRRLERAEGQACVRFAAARGRLFPESAAGWVECAGALAAFDGVDSPVTQSFGLGLFDPLTEAGLDAIEGFFQERGAVAVHEVSPFAGVAAVELLCRRGYRPVEMSHVMYRVVKEPESALPSNIRVRIAAAEEGEIWADVNARGWAQEHPELLDTIRQMGPVMAAREQSPCFLAELDGRTGAAGALCLHDGVALFAGAATIPEMRRRGLQTALLHERLRYAFEHACDLAMMVAEPGSDSQRNAERRGFRIAYTRTKWRLVSTSVRASS